MLRKLFEITFVFFKKAYKLYDKIFRFRIHKKITQESLSSFKTPSSKRPKFSEAPRKCDPQHALSESEEYENA